MSIAIMSEVWKKYGKGGSRKLVLLALADYANDEGLCWPGTELIAVKCNITRRFVQEILRELEADGWLHTMTNDGPYDSNLYRVIVPESAVDYVGEHKAAKQARVRNLELPSFGPTREPLFTPPVNPGSPNTPLEPSTKNDATKVAPLEQEPSKYIESLTEGQRYFLESFGAKRYKNHIQAETVARLESVYGFNALKPRIRWAANKGMSVGAAIVAIESALDRPKGKKSTQVMQVNPGKPQTVSVDPANPYGKST